MTTVTPSGTNAGTQEAQTCGPEHLATPSRVSPHRLPLAPALAARLAFAGDLHPFEKSSLLFPLRTHVLPDAKALAQKLPLLSDTAFAGLKGACGGMPRLPSVGPDWRLR